MTTTNAVKGKRPVRKPVAPVTDDAFASRQLSLFQGFLAIPTMNAKRFPMR